MKQTLVMLTVMAMVFASNPFDDQYCRLDSDERLQIAILLDKHEKFKNALNDTKRFLKDFVTFIKLNYTNAEFALSYFSRWDYNPGAGEEYTKQCYVPQVKFTSNVETFFKEAKPPEKFAKKDTPNINVADAAAFAITDKSIGWIPEDMDEEGQPVRRLLVILSQNTEHTTAEKKDIEIAASKRLAFIGDGTDTCEHAKSVPMPKLQEILQEKRVCVVGIYAANQKYFEQLYYDLRVIHYGVEYGTNNLSLKELAQEGFKHCMLCVWADPGGYNTLGY